MTGECPCKRCGSSLARVCLSCVEEITRSTIQRETLQDRIVRLAGALDDGSDYDAAHWQAIFECHLLDGENPGRFDRINVRAAELRAALKSSG